MYPGIIIVKYSVCVQRILSFKVSIHSGNTGVGCFCFFNLQSDSGHAKTTTIKTTYSIRIDFLCSRFILRPSMQSIFCCDFLPDKEEKQNKNPTASSPNRLSELFNFLGKSRPLETGARIV